MKEKDLNINRKRNLGEKLTSTGTKTFEMNRASCALLWRPIILAARESNDRNEADETISLRKKEKERRRKKK